MINNTVHISTKPPRLAFCYIGGKSKAIRYLFPSDNKLPVFNNYCEPFVGGGAVFFHLAKLNPTPAWLSDSCPMVINAYLQIRDNPEALSESVRRYLLQIRRQTDFFYRLRDALAEEEDKLEKAAAFISLQKVSLYGLRGHLDVRVRTTRYGSTVPPFKLMSDALQNADIILQDFRKTPIKKKSLYYLDPPFWGQAQPYSNKFDLQDHYDLKLFCDRVNKKGSHFIVSLGNSGVVQSFYKDYQITRLPPPPRKIGSAVTHGEVIVRNF